MVTCNAYLANGSLSDNNASVEPTVAWRIQGSRIDAVLPALKLS
jgi:hypothetical protein